MGHMGRSRKAFFLAALIILSGCASGGGDPYNRAVDHYSKGRINESVSDYKRAIMANQSDPQAKFNLAVIYQDGGKLDEAERLYNEILQKYPDYAPALSNLGSIQEKRGMKSAAEQSYRRAMEVDKDDSWTASQFGYFMLRTGREDEAAALFEESIKRDFRCSNAWYGLGLIAEGKGDARTALKNYDRAIMYNPSDLHACLKAADIKLARGDIGGAAALFQKAAAIDPSRGDIQLTLGRLLREEGKFKESEKVLERARKAGAPQAECDRELSIVYGKLSEEAATKAGEAPRN